MPLKGLRVVELGTLPAASYCARLFADFGAEVRKIEPPAGDPTRHAHPLVDLGASGLCAPEESPLRAIRIDNAGVRLEEGGHPRRHVDREPGLDVGGLEQLVRRAARLQRAP